MLSAISFIIEFFSLPLQLTIMFKTSSCLAVNSSALFHFQYKNQSEQIFPQYVYQTYASNTNILLCFNIIIPLKITMYVLLISLPLSLSAYIGVKVIILVITDTLVGWAETSKYLKTKVKVISMAATRDFGNTNPIGNWTIFKFLLRSQKLLICFQ